MLDFPMKYCASEDFEAAAARRLPAALYSYIAGGAFDEVTLTRNRHDLLALKLRPRIMSGVSSPDLSTRFLGHTSGMPVILGPVGLAGMVARRGEVQAAAAARGSEVPFCLSNVSICDVEEVAANAAPPWFQLYILRDREQTKCLLSIARQYGCRVLVVTVDVPTAGIRHREIRSGIGRGIGLSMALDALRRPAWLWNVWARGRPHSLGTMSKALYQGERRSLAPIDVKPDLGWDDLDWLRAHWNGPIIVKGIMEAADARIAINAGANGIVVSNHGGRQLDGISSTIARLPAIADVVGADAELFIDGGIRSGLDVLKALACGAKGCFLGRAWVLALAAGGEIGVRQLLETIRVELAAAMILTGCNSVGDVGPSLLADTQ